MEVVLYLRWADNAPEPHDKAIISSWAVITVGSCQTADLKVDKRKTAWILKAFFLPRDRGYRMNKSWTGHCLFPSWYLSGVNCCYCSSAAIPTQIKQWAPLHPSPIPSVSFFSLHTKLYLCLPWPFADLKVCFLKLFFFCRIQLNIGCYLTNKHV